MNIGELVDFLICARFEFHVFGSASSASDACTLQDHGEDRQGYEKEHERQGDESDALVYQVAPSYEVKVSTSTLRPRYRSRCAYVLLK